MMDSKCTYEKSQEQREENDIYLFILFKFIINKKAIKLIIKKLYKSRNVLIT